MRASRSPGCASTSTCRPERPAADVAAELVRVGLEEEGVHGGDLSGPLVVGRVLSSSRSRRRTARPSAGARSTWSRGRQRLTGTATPSRASSAAPTTSSSATRSWSPCPAPCCPAASQISARKTYGHVSDGMICLRPRARPRRGPRRHPRAVPARARSPEVGTDAIALLGLDDEASRSTSRPTAATASRCAASPASTRHATGTPSATRPSEVQAPAALAGGYARRARRRGADLRQARLRPLRGPHRARRRRRPAHPAVDAARLQLAGHAVRSRWPSTSPTTSCSSSASRCTRYDLDKLAGGIVVRRAARRGEAHHPGRRRAHARPRGPADHRRHPGPIGIAGVMGGAAHRDRPTPRRTCWSRPRTSTRSRSPAPRAATSCRPRRPSASSAASTRRWPRRRRSASSDLLVELAGGTADEAGHRRRTAPDAVTIELPAEYAAARIGIDFTEEQIVDLARGPRRRRCQDRRRLHGRPPRAGARTWRPRTTSPRRSPGWSATTRSRRPCRWRPRAAA